jgi:hypothetical protein
MDAIRQEPSRSAEPPPLSTHRSRHAESQKDGPLARQWPCAGHHSASAGRSRNQQTGYETPAAQTDTALCTGLVLKPNRRSIASVSAVQGHNIRLPGRVAIARYG